MRSSRVCTENWKEAQSDFFESFRNYDEAGSLQRIQVLKYLVLTTMLMKSDINPFDSQETKPCVRTFLAWSKSTADGHRHGHHRYKNDSRIAAMTDLVDAYQRDDIHRYQTILENSQDVLGDPFIAENIDEVTRNIRTQATLRLIKPYSSFTLAFVAKRLRISEDEAEDIVCFLIIDGKVRAKIYQPDGTVRVEGEGDVQRLDSVGGWSSALESLWTKVLEDGEGFRAEDLPSPYHPPSTGYAGEMQRRSDDRKAYDLFTRFSEPRRARPGKMANAGPR